MAHIHAVGVLNEEALNISLGRVDGTSALRKFGANASVGTTREDIWSVGGVYPWPIVAETVRIKAGGNVADTSAGSGARSVIVEGLDENWEVVTETLVTAGVNASASTSVAFHRVYRVTVASVGEYTGRNVGVITIENTTTNGVLAEIQAEYGQTQMTQYTVPAGKRALLFPPSITVDANQPSNVRICQRRNADALIAPFSPVRIVFEVDAFVGSKDFAEIFPTLLPAKTDVWAEGRAAAATASMNIRYALMLVEE